MSDPTYTDQLISYLRARLKAKTSETVIKHVETFRALKREEREKQKEKLKETVGVCHFGKYKGKKWALIHDFDPQYLCWLMKQSFLEDRTLKEIKEAVSGV